MRIAVRTPNWLGDAVMSLPALADLRSTFPRAEIDCYAVAAAAGVLERFDAADRVVRLPDVGRMRRLLRFVPELRRRRYDVGIVFPPSFSSALLFFLGGVGERIGFTGDGRRPLLTAALGPPARGRVHLADAYRMLVASAAERRRRPLVPVTPPPVLSLTDADRQRGRSVMEQRPRPWVALAPGAVYGDTKRWPPERYAQLCDLLVRRHGASPVLTGSDADREVCERVTSEAKADVLNLAGHTDSGSVAALFGQMDLVVSNDSGAMHLASVAGAAVVAIFGSTNPDWTAPIGPRVRIVRRDEPCAPCYSPRCDVGIVCLTRIEVEEVYQACRPFLT
jgi:heptosyltransferase-2